MSKRAWVIVILIALIVNVVSLQFVIEGYYGREDHLVAGMTILSMVSVIVTVVAYLKWHKLEYKK